MFPKHCAERQTTIYIGLIGAHVSWARLILTSSVCNA